MGRMKSISSIVLNPILWVLVIDHNDIHYLLQWNTLNENLNVLLAIGWVFQFNILKQEVGLSEFLRMVFSE